MIDLYSWPTPNGRKISIALEELGVPYAVHAVDIGKGAQLTPGVPRREPQQQDPSHC